MKVGIYFLLFGLMMLGGDETAAQSDTVFLERWHFYRQRIVGVYDLEGNFNPGRYHWSILTPSPSQFPAIPKYVDPNQIVPFQEVPRSSETQNRSTLIYRKCHDSDRCEFSFSQPETPVAKGRLIRLAGIQTPHLKAACELEAFLGNQAKNLLHEYLSSALHIELRNFSENRREIVGRVIADGQDLSELLVNQGFAVLVDKNKKDWCS